MKESAYITIKGVQKADGVRNVTEFKTDGLFERKKDAYFIYFDEIDERDVKTKTVIRVTDDSMSLRRVGSVSETMMLRKNERHIMQYGTEVGELMFGVNTKDLKCRLDEKGGRITVKYDLEYNSSLMSEHGLSITVTKR